MSVTIFGVSVFVYVHSIIAYYTHFVSSNQRKSGVEFHVSG